MRDISYKAVLLRVLVTALGGAMIYVAFILPPVINYSGDLAGAMILIGSFLLAFGLTGIPK